MRIVGIYSFNRGKEVIETNFSQELGEIKDVLARIDAAKYKNKISKEKTMPGKILYKPGELNQAFQREFEGREWYKQKVFCEYPTQYYVSDFTSEASSRR